MPGRNEQHIRALNSRRRFLAEPNLLHRASQWRRQPTEVGGANWKEICQRVWGHKSASGVQGPR